VRSERQREREERGKTQRESKNRGGGDIVATNITAATVPKPRVTNIGTPLLPLKKKKEREKERERKNQRRNRKRQKETERE